jgi:hypothetical protein
MRRRLVRSLVGLGVAAISSGVMAQPAPMVRCEPHGRPNARGGCDCNPGFAARHDAARNVIRCRPTSAPGSAPAPGPIVAPPAAAAPRVPPVAPRGPRYCFEYEPGVNQSWITRCFAGEARCNAEQDRRMRVVASACDRGDMCLSAPTACVPDLSHVDDGDDLATPRADREAAQPAEAPTPDVAREDGALVVTSDAADSEVWMDGRRVALLPLTSPLRVRAGRFVVEVLAPNHLSALREVEVLPGGVVRVSVAPEVANGIRITDPTPDLHVSIDGVSMPLRPIMALAPGPHDVRLDGEGLAPRVVTVTVERGGIHNVGGRLVRIGQPIGDSAAEHQPAAFENSVSQRLAGRVAGRVAIGVGSTVACVSAVAMLLLVRDGNEAASAYNSTCRVYGAPATCGTLRVETQQRLDGTALAVNVLIGVAGAGALAAILARIAMPAASDATSPNARPRPTLVLAPTYAGVQLTW